VQLDVRVIIFIHLATQVKFSCVFVDNTFVIKVKVEQDLLVILGSEVYVTAQGHKHAKSVIKNFFEILLACTAQIKRFLGGAIDSIRVTLCNKKAIDILKIIRDCLLS